MTVQLNTRLVRLSLACIQPASTDAVRGFMELSLPDGAGTIDAHSVDTLLSGWVESGDVAPVHMRPNLFSLTRQGDDKLTAGERRLRDRTRLFLLKDLRNGSLRPAEARVPEKADVSSAVSTDPAAQEERPTVGAGSARAAHRTGPAYWPLLSKQLQVGSSPLASAPNLRFLSFRTIKACCLANGLPDIPEDGIGLNEIALALGVSPGLLRLLIRRTERHYRTFTIPKANGKPRQIRAPRTMLKMVQYFILDYLLRPLPVDPAATAFSTGCSIRENALPHVGKKFVANIDVADFFGSLSLEVVFRQLVKAGLRPTTAWNVAALSSFEGALPQGAPTSAALSNICLAAADEVISAQASQRNVQYTRYADDITFSGDDKSAVLSCVDVAREELARLGLKLNPEKTRLFGPSSRQVVTGVVVNKKAQPSRIERRKLRAALFEATRSPQRYADDLSKLQGKVSYVLSFSSEEGAVGGVSREAALAAFASIRGVAATRRRSRVGSRPGAALADERHLSENQVMQCRTPNHRTSQRPDCCGAIERDSLGAVWRDLVSDGGPKLLINMGF